jgi:NADH-quinone oxidoreductase subunit G
MEFLLINHPLDCPICDQGGECELQDVAVGYGSDVSRYSEGKRVVMDEDLGPLIATDMTRCIHCTRCVRFGAEIAGVREMGATGRGEHMRIGVYVSKTVDHELSGNIIDLCPVGALVSKPYAFTARPWELTKTESIDVMDALGSSIRVDTKGREVMRILPRNHDGVNEEWLSDKSRYAWDGLRRQRLDKPYIRENGKLRAADWGEALQAAAAAMKGAKVSGIVGDLAPVEAVYALKELIEGQGGVVECRTDGAKLPAGNRSAYAGTAAIEDIDTAKAIMLIGTDPRAEAPVLNARIRKAWSRGANIGLIGEAVDLTYDYAHLGTGRDALRGLMDMSPEKAHGKDTLVIIGQGALTSDGGKGVLADAMAYADATQSKLLVLHSAASRVGALDVGAVASESLDEVLAADVIYNLGADEIEVPAGATVIYQGSHGDRGAHRADIILPAAAWTEENGLFVNTEGRPQLALRASFPPGEAKENWAILRALSAELDATLPFDSLAQLRKALVEAVPHLKDIDQVPENAWEPVEAGGDGSGDFGQAVGDHYLTNPILRAAPLMAELQAGARERKAGKLAAE